MLPTLCGLLLLFVPLASDPPEILSPQVISREPRSRQGVIPQVTSVPALPVRAAPGIPTTFRSDTPFDPAVVVLEKHEEAVGFEAPQARSEDTRIRYEPGLLAKLVLSGRMGRGGVTVMRLLNASKTTEGDEVSVMEKTIYRAKALVVVSVELKLSATATTPWVPGEAWLLDAQGRVVGRFPVWMDGTRLGPGEGRTVALEVELVPGAEPRALQLELREKDGGRTVRVGDLEL